MAVISFSLTAMAGVFLLVWLGRDQPQSWRMIAIIAIVTLIHFLVVGVASAVFANALLTAVFLTPVIEETGRFLALRQVTNQKVRDAAFIALGFATAETLATLQRFQNGEGSASAIAEFGPDVYFATAFPLFLLIDMIGHTLFGLIMVRFWKSPVLRLALPITLHAALNAIGRV